MNIAIFLLDRFESSLLATKLLFYANEFILERKVKLDSSANNYYSWIRKLVSLMLRKRLRSQKEESN